MAEAAALTDGPMDSWRQLGRDLAANPKLRRRGWILVLTGVVALALGFVAVDAEQAERALREAGYYIMLAAFGCFVTSLLAYRTRILNAWPFHFAWKECALIAVVLGGALWITWVSEPLGYKVVNDEFVLQATALNLHLDREPAVLVRAYYLDGVFSPLYAYADKRPFFFAFLVSLMHDLTGYRLENAFILNHALSVLNVLLVFLIGRRLSGNLFAALTAAVLWAGLPLFAQNAGGCGMELLNATMILIAVLLAWDYMEAPDESRATALGFATVLLAQTRYESVVFVPIVGVVIIVGWVRARRIILPGGLVFVPLLLLPYAWQHQVTTANKALWELQSDQTSRFGLQYLAGNLRGAVEFYFAQGNRMIANSWLLSVTTAVGLSVAAGCLVCRRRILRPSPLGWSVLLFGAGVVANFALLMFYYWGRLSDPVVARLGLPSLMFGSLATAWLLGRLASWRIDLRWAFVGASIYIVGFMRPQMANGFYTHFNLPVQQLDWEKEFLRARPPAQRLIMSNKTVLPWIIERQPAIALNPSRERKDQLRFHLAARTWAEIIVTQRLTPSSETGDFVVDPGDALPDAFRLEVLGEKRFGAYIARISRLIAVDAEAAPKGSDS